MGSYSYDLGQQLRPYVNSCEGYDFRLAVDAVHHGVPSMGLTLIFAFDEPLDCGWLDSDTHGRYDILLAGLHTRPSLVRTHGHQHGIQLSLTPLGARALLGRPSAELASEIVPAPLAGVPAQLHEQLQSSDWPQRFAILERFLRNQIRQNDDATIRPETAHAWRLISRSHGRIGIADLAGEVGWSRRRLLDAMRHEMGISPKQAARIARLEHARCLLGSGEAIADIAVTCGYADQPHLNREWRALTGMTPTQSLNDFPIIQDAAPV